MNLAALIEAHPPGAVALAGPDPVTYGKLRTDVATLRGRLAGAGVFPGDRVALVAGNEPAFVVAYLAVLGVGGVAVPLNPASPPAEMGAELTAVGATLAVVGPAGLDAVARLDRSAVGLQQVLAAEAPAERPTDAPLLDRDAADPAALLFTAGTSGQARAAVLTHGNLLANIDSVQRHPGRAVLGTDVCLGVLPLFHIFGLNVVLGLSLRAGAAVALVPRFDPAGTLGLVRETGVSILAGAPAMYRSWVALPPEGAGPEALAGVRLAFSGAAPLAAGLAAAFEARFGVPLREGYGLTEAGPVVTTSVLSGPPRPGSIGVPVPGVDVRLVDEEGEDALDGDPGEVWVRGPNVFSGYWEDPEATARVLTADGWLRTGDVGVAGPDGELYLVDRLKDLVLVSGFNVYPAEVEEVLLQHPGVAEVAVVGRPDGRTGEAVSAYVVAAAGTPAPTPDELSAFCRKRMARYKCPTLITLVPALDRGLGGKLLRRTVGPPRPARA